MTEDRRNAPYTYADAGVSIAGGNALVRAIAPLARATRRAGADADLGGFGGFFDLRAAGFSDPLLVAANDGVGTKLKLAIDHGRHALSAASRRTSEKPLEWTPEEAMPRITSPGAIALPVSTAERSTAPTQKPARS